MIVTKISASGNDFVLFHTFKKEDRSNLAKVICDRYNGVGADGLIVLLPNSEYDFEWQFYNSDGSEAKMCGNGSRAAAFYAYKNNLAGKKMKFLTKAGVIECEVEDDIVKTQLTPFKELGVFKEWEMFDTGVEHLVKLDKISNFNLDECRKLRYEFNANVNVAEVKDGKLFVRTYERGVEDETLACGTGMCASFLKARKEGLIKDKVKVYPKSNEELEIEIEDNKLYLKGKVKEVFVANVNISNIL